MAGSPILHVPAATTNADAVPAGAVTVGAPPLRLPGRGPVQAPRSLADFEPL